jgi:hypothetical protein
MGDHPSMACSKLLPTGGDEQVMIVPATTALCLPFGIGASTLIHCLFDIGRHQKIRKWAKANTTKLAIVLFCVVFHELSPIVHREACGLTKKQPQKGERGTLLNCKSRL